MNRKEDLITDIVEQEWKMFQAVPNIGGRAACQEDLKTFRIMRTSQAMSWSEAVLDSYLDDLKQAESSGRNLLTEKYARMMQSTSPAEYAHIAHILPPVDPEAVSLIESIAAVVLEWERALLGKYPRILRRGRPVFSKDDTLFVTSLETYLKGELATYSLKTLRLYLENVLQQKSENINGSEITLAHTMKQYGFTSLEVAEEKLKRLQ